MIKYQIKKVIEYLDWNSFVIENYNKPYNFQQQDGCQGRGTYELDVPCDSGADFENDTIPYEINGEEMGVSFLSWLNTDIVKGNPFLTQNNINLFWERNFYPNIEMIANDLHSKGLLEAGTYTINIDW